ncbi:MAG: hypothetical protein ACRDVC_01950 [Acidimicrobiales bacterium]
MLLVMATLTLSASNASATVKIPNACALLKESLAQNSIGKLYHVARFLYSPSAFTGGVACFAHYGGFGVTLELENVNEPYFEGFAITTSSNQSGLGSGALLVKGTTPEQGMPFRGVTFNRGGIYAALIEEVVVAPSEVVVMARTILPHL